LTFELDLDSIKLNQHAKYLSHRSRSSKLVVRTHTPNRLLYLDH